MNHDKVMHIAKKRGFIWSSFEIYSGVAGFVDYGPLGALLKNKITEKWRQYYIINEGFYEIESPTIMPEEALKASGHVDHFEDPMIECNKCLEVFRADHIINNATGKDVEGLPNEKLTKIISDNKISCPRCGGAFTKVWSYNLMFQTVIGAKGKKTGYMRPETAQGIFIPFKRLLRFFRGKLPFGVVQIGKAYRNEISPRQGVIRLREFTQAEAEIFVNPKNKSHERFSEIEEIELTLYSAENQIENRGSVAITIKNAISKGLVSSEMLIYQLYLAKKFLVDLGIPEEVIRFRQHLPTEMAHYAIDCWDVEVKLDKFGWIEVIGIADRTDFDLKSHSKHSKEDLRVFIEYKSPKKVKKKVIRPDMKKFGPSFKGESPKIIKALENVETSVLIDSFKTKKQYELELEDKTFIIPYDHVNFEEIEESMKGEKVFPHVIEPSYGIDRIVYSTLLHSYLEDDERSFFKLKRDIAPVEVSVFPLVNKEKMVKIALQIRDNLRKEGFLSEYDSSGTIGRRYARSDEIGVPFAVTVDHETPKTDTVTLRNRDDSKQIRVPISEIHNVLGDLISFKIDFKDIEN